MILRDFSQRKSIFTRLLRCILIKLEVFSQKTVFYCQIMQQQFTTEMYLGRLMATKDALSRNKCFYLLANAEGFTDATLTLSRLRSIMVSR